MYLLYLSGSCDLPTLEHDWFLWTCFLTGVACVCRDGHLQERDQILVINGSPLEPGISQQQALTLLQQPGETVELVVARDRPPDAPSAQATPTSTVRELLTVPPV